MIHKGSYRSKTTASQSGIVNDGTLFSASDDINAASSGANNPLFLIRNPSGSGKDVYVWRGRLGSIVTNTAMLFRIFSNPTVTLNGSAVPIVNRNIGGVSNPSPVAQVFELPTVSANGSQLTTVVAGQNTSSIDVNEEFAIRLNPGNSLLVTGTPTSNNRAAAVTLVWQELEQV